MKDSSSDLENIELLSYYTFDASNADDVSGNEHHGYTIGDVKYIDNTPSGSGQALFLNGIKNQYVSIPSNVFAGRVSYSMSFWIKDFSKGSIIAAISSDGVRSDFPSIFAGNTQFIFYTRYDNYDDTSPFNYDFTSIMSPDWHHIVVTCHNNGQLLGRASRCLYIDGKLVAQDQDGSQGYVNIHGWDENIITNIHFGGNRNGRYAIASSMKIDNIRFYSGAISPVLVKELYEGKK